MSSPNTWAKATVKNEWGSTISVISLKHRYDDDHYDQKEWASLANGATGESFDVGYWTGFGRTGKDYWLISFEADGQVWTCKSNFYCYLTGDDENKTVICRVYKDGTQGKMQVICPGSSNCTVSLDSNVSIPNTWAKATVENDWGSTISIVSLKHRYDEDHYDQKEWSSISNGATGESFAVGYWTGFGRTGKDYWLISFEADGKLWTCKDNFYCFLRSDDEGGTVRCRVYKDGNEGKMEVICPGSSNCTVSLESAVATPNTWAKATVENDWGSTITKVQLNHRYDNDHFDAKSWPTINNGAIGESFAVGYWTGFGRTGKDYWLISFEADGKLWTCKDNFYCFLKKADAEKTVRCRVYQDGNEGKMEVICPGSSNCTVSLTSKSAPSTNTRPIYVIGHRCNDSEDIGIALSRGCNAIECDLQYNGRTREIYVNHDKESGTSLSNWLSNAKRIKDLYPRQFALIIFDCKFAAEDKNTAITSQVLFDVRKIVREYLNGGTEAKINVIFSVASFDDRNTFSKIWSDLDANEGLAIDEHNDPHEVEKFFKDNNVKNCWYGNGTFSLGISLNIKSSIKLACYLRDRNQVLKKVYIWTLAKKKSIKYYLSDASYRVDGVMVNVPGTIAGIAPVGLEDALEVISETKSAHLAIRSDNAFFVYPG